ncbi:MAG: HU family DNA-binding protein [SAR324 cluster bacterium]|nr:HU family DNA-binding protein [SAR324 cluster bacterium]MBF0351513.1 HU family DNA-binding protein [SAR324 cluster bacterium]
MTKAELVAAIADNAERTKADAERFLNATIKAIEDALAKGETIPLIGFGTFSVSERPARIGRNPRTKEELKIPASKSVKFKVGSKLKDAVNK